MPKYLPFFLALLLLSGPGCVRKNYFQKTALVQPEAFYSTPGLPDSAVVTVGRHYKKSKFHNIFWGKHYRNLWATPVTVPVFRMEREKGGLKPTSMGGGFQTTSLSLKDSTGRSFVLRSLDKDPQKTLPPFLRRSFLVNVLRDQTSAANPFAPLVLPKLSQAAGINYSTPQLFYVAPNDSSFGKFGPRVLGKVMLLEEKFIGQEWAPQFKNSQELVESEVYLHKRFTDSRHQADQQLFARSRLFDVLIGDWDRHEGQWNWAVYKQNKTFLYKPIPKDRDQAFYVFNDGFFPWLMSRPFLLKKFQTFKADYGYLPGWLFNARFIDSRTLNSVTKADWIRHAEELKAALTDQIIADAFRELPDPVYRQTAAETMAKLKARRDKLPEAAAEIYELLSKETWVAGSDDDENFVVNRLPSGETEVKVYRSGQQNKAPFFSRTFHPDETKTIILHGLNGTDEFKISGKAKSGIMVKIYGGAGEDEISDRSEVKGSRKLTLVYDSKRGVVIKEKSKETAKTLSRDPAIHAFDRDGL